jgi:Mrp family chromosome partitioning ATPase
MGKIYKAMKGMYPELDELSDADFSDNDRSNNETNNQTNKPETRTEDSAQTTTKLKQDAPQTHNQYASFQYGVTADKAFVSKADSRGLPAINDKLKPIEDNKWIRALNRIVTKVAGAISHKGGLIFFVGSEPSVGSTTVSYWAARLLASYSEEHRALFVSISDKKVKKNQTDIFAELKNGNLTEEEVLSNLSYETFNHIVLHIDKKTLQAPATPNAINRLVRAAKLHFHWVVMDSPPLLTVPPVYSLAAESDGVVIVAKAAKTRIPTLNAMTQELEERGAKILGVVLNFRQFPLPGFLMKFF